MCTQKSFVHRKRATQAGLYLSNKHGTNLITENFALIGQLRTCRAGCRHSRSYVCQCAHNFRDLGNSPACFRLCHARSWTSTLGPANTQNRVETTTNAMRKAAAPTLFPSSAPLRSPHFKKSWLIPSLLTKDTSPEYLPDATIEHLWSLVKGTNHTTQAHCECTAVPQLCSHNFTLHLHTLFVLTRPHISSSYHCNLILGER